MQNHRDPDSAMTARLDAVLAGDAVAIDAFCREQHPRVYRLCLGFLACTAEAEDLAQDAMLRVLDKLAQRDPGRRFDTWRNRVVLNLCRDRVRLLKRRRRAEREAAQEGVGRDADTGPYRSELRSVLTAALRRLPEREREAIVLRDLEGNDTDEVAQVMGVQPSSVRSLTTLARRRLRELLASTVGPDIEGEVHRAR